MDSDAAGTTPLPAKPGGMTREQGHALMNIFGIVIANAEMLQEEAGPESHVQRRLERIVEACRRGEELVRVLRRPAMARPDDRESRPAGKAAATVPSPCRILVVDDEEDLLDIICRYLTGDGFVALGLPDSRLALEQVRADPFAFDLLLTDVDMPGLSGANLCRQVHALRPDLPLLMVTGYDRHAPAGHLAEMGVREMLMKPVRRQVLLATVRRLLTP